VLELELIDVRIEETTKQPFLELRPNDGSNRILPIFIGMAEAAAIKSALDEKRPHRPMTHDLFISTLDATGVSIDQIVITEYRQRVFYAELHLTVARPDTAVGRREVVSSRPSDAIALAVRANAKILVNDAVLVECAVPDLAVTKVADGEGNESGDTAIVDEFRKFIDDISPEDFK
jgi:uncharacterized protein